MIRYGTFTYDWVAQFITSEPNKKMVLACRDLQGNKTVRINSLRLQCFKRSPVCVVCGRKGTRFAVEKSNESDCSAHLNLYCVEDGKEILMTHDHIIPRTKGGRNHLDNVQTMCHKCNEKKDSTVPKQFSGKLTDLIAHWIASGLNDREIVNLLSNSDMLEKIGYTPQGSDLIAIIREFMTEKPERAKVCTECPHVLAQGEFYPGVGVRHGADC